MTAEIRRFTVAPPDPRMVLFNRADPDCELCGGFGVIIGPDGHDPCPCTDEPTT